MKHVKANKQFVKKSQWNEIYLKSQAIKLSEVNFKESLKANLKDIRMGGASSIQDVVDNFDKSECSPEKILDFIEAHDWLIIHFEQISRDQYKGMWRD